MGRGDLGLVRHAAPDATRLVLGTVDMNGMVVIGEDEAGETPMLSIGESIGNGKPPHVDVAVSPVDGMALIANGLNTLKDDLETGDGAATDE